jgi:outer membrane protein TolC
MRSYPISRRDFVPLALLVLLALPFPARADAPLAREEAPLLDLDTCRRIALERQPALAAYRASLAAAEAKVKALDSLRVPVFLRPDLPIRRKQACIGLSVAQAMYIQQEWETVYAVNRTYLTVLYAQEQTKVARDLLQILQNLKDTTEGLAGKKESNVTVLQYQRVLALLEVAAGRQQEAAGGVERAKAALREAMGVDPDFPLTLPAGQLRADPPALTREQVIALAVERRPELVQASGAAEAAALEVKAQGKSFRPTAQTFASGADIHAQPVVQGLRDGDYRPGAVGLDMPVQLSGSRCYRVDQAQALGGRADAVLEKARGLIALDAADVYFRYLDWSTRAPRLRQAAKLAEERSNDVRGRFDPRAEKPRATLDEVLDASTLATQLRLDRNEAEFHYLVILADLERVTAGGFCPNYLPPANGNAGSGATGAAPPAMLP